MIFLRLISVLIGIVGTLCNSAWAIKAGGINDGLVQDQIRGGLYPCEWNLEDGRDRAQVIEYQTLLNSDLRQRLRSDSGLILQTYLGSVLAEARNILDRAPISPVERLSWRVRLEPLPENLPKAERSRVIRETISALLELNVLLQERGEYRLAFWSDNALTTARRHGIEYVPDQAQAHVDLGKLDETAAMVREQVRFFTDEFSGLRAKFVYAIAGSIGNSPELLEEQTSKVLAVKVHIRLPVRMRYVLFALQQSLNRRSHAEMRTLLIELNNYLNLARVQWALEHPGQNINIDIFEC